MALPEKTELQKMSELMDITNKYLEELDIKTNMTVEDIERIRLILIRYC
jgi:hypothetical protein